MTAHIVSAGDILTLADGVTTVFVEDVFDDGYIAVSFGTVAQPFVFVRFSEARLTDFAGASKAPLSKSGG